MKLIAHRGNIRGPNPLYENSPRYILKALDQGYDVEIDLWFVKNKWFLGHDKPQYEIPIEFILENKDRYWCHAKNKNALFNLVKINGINCFWHQDDYYTLTSKSFIWVYPGQPLVENSICVMPERVNYTSSELKICHGICTDYVAMYKNQYS